MIERRQLLTMGGLLGALAPGGGEGNAQQMSPQATQDITNAIKDIKTALAAEWSFAEIAPVRAQQLSYLKANAKFPDFIDVGSDVWYAVHDWHVRLQQQLVFGPLTATRQGYRAQSPSCVDGGCRLLSLRLVGARTPTGYPNAMPGIQDTCCSWTPRRLASVYRAAMAAAARMSTPTR